MLAILVRYAWSFCRYSMWLLIFFFFFTLEFATSNDNKKKTYIGEIVSQDHSPSDRWWWKFVPFLWCWRLYWLALALDVTFNTSLSEVAAIRFLSPLFSTQGHTVLGSVSGRRRSSTIDCTWMDEVIGMPLVWNTTFHIWVCGWYQRWSMIVVWVQRACALMFAHWLISQLHLATKL